MQYLKQGKANLILDGQIGSCGKGKIGGYLALHDQPEWAACVYSPNAGHTFVSDSGDSVLVKQVPQSVVNPKTKLIIGADAAINLDVLKKEIEQFKLDPTRLFVSDRAVIIENKDVEWEKEHLKRIASTFQGVGAAKARKVRRDSSVRLAADIDWLKPFTCDTTHLVHYVMALPKPETILVEGHQGAGLDVNHGVSFPFCTSSMTNSSYFFAALGIPPSKTGEIIGVVRPYPIRVGNFKDGQGYEGSSGPLPHDSEEMSWAQVAEACGGPSNLIEMTSVTKRVRRVMTWSDSLFKRFVDTSGPTQIAMNFIAYVDWSDYGKSGDFSVLSQKSKNFINKVEDVGGVPVTLIGTGAKNGEILTKQGTPSSVAHDSEGNYYNPDTSVESVN